MVGFRANIGYFEQRVLHDLLLHSEVILDFAWLLDRSGKRTELARRRRAAGQIRIEGEGRKVARRGDCQVTECPEVGRRARFTGRPRERKYVVMENTESRPHDRGSAPVELPRKAGPRLEVLFAYGKPMVLQNRR